MKSLVLFIATFHTLLAFNYSLEPKSVGAATQCFFGFPQVMDERNNGNISNSCFVNMGTSYLAIDSGPSYSYAKQAYDKIKQINDLPISYLVNTHVHDDHWLGNSHYKEIGVKIIGSSEFATLPILEKTRMQKRISKEAYAKTTQTIPDVFVEDEKVLDFNGKKVYIRSVNHKAHTKSDLLVYVPSEKIVFVGDLVFNGRLPSLRDGDVNGWLKALERIKSMDVEHIVGGHGTIVSKESVDFTYNYLMTLKTEVSALMEEGDDIGDVVNKVEMLEYKDVNFYDAMHRQNVEQTYRMLEWANE